MDSINRQLREPWWQPSRIDITRRRALLGLSAMVMAAAGSTHILGQQARSCVLTPNAERGLSTWIRNSFDPTSCQASPEPRCNSRSR